MQTDIFKYLKQNQPTVLEKWMTNQLTDTDLREDLMSNEELRAESGELVKEFLKGLSPESINNPESPDFDPVLEILGGISISRAQQGYSPKETGLFVISLKEALIDLIDDGQWNAEAKSQSIRSLNRLFDSFSIYTFETFIKGREEVILRQTDEITEISTPVIRIWDNILALPIIGTLDSARTQVVMESLLTEIVATGSSIAILDISGVPTVDSLVAQHLLKTVSATRLMGAECIISGIRPEIAQTIVHLGIDLSGIITKSSLASALAHAFKTQRLEVKQVPINNK